VKWRVVLKQGDKFKDFRVNVLIYKKYRYHFRFLGTLVRTMVTQERPQTQVPLSSYLLSKVRQLVTGTNIYRPSLQKTPTPP